ncbi:hypothetical protein FACS1894102_3980 [Spirochaetia bacterium]|nr:hypothetical protein FACS1894102_3980 [Spirochaetia bacterium]
MPFKYLSEQKYKYDKEEAAAYMEQLVEVLSLPRKPVGVKLINSEAEFTSIDAPQVSRKMSYCQMIKDASLGDFYKSRRENHSCDGATIALALEGSTPEIESGETYFSYNLYATKAAARRMRAGIAGLPYPNTKTFGVLTGPLDAFLMPPDVVILIVNAGAAMRLVQGWEYETGIAPDVKLGAMQAFCAELTVRPILSGSMNLSVFCPSTRMLAAWSENEMGVSIPFERFYAVIKGVIATAKS